jgi:hypothetical protein
VFPLRQDFPGSLAELPGHFALAPIDAVLSRTLESFPHFIEELS